MFEGTKLLHPHCVGGMLGFDVLLFNSLAGNKKMVSQTCYPVRVQESIISQLKCNSDLEATQLRLRCCSAAMGGQEHLWTALVLRF